MKPVWILTLITAAAIPILADHKKSKASTPSELDLYLQQFSEADNSTGVTSPGSLWSPNARLLDLGADLRASRAGDLVSIIVEERASAIASGTTKTSRAANAKASVTSVAGMSPPALGALAQAGSQQSLAGEGTTSRGNSLRTTLAAQVSRVLPNGALLIQGSKQVTINSENQLVSLRGIIRPVDITTGNAVRTERIALLEVKVNGKGVVNDAVRRPNFLYRLLLGILPF
jgi:flagellar L-ring protein FlgH